MQLSLQVTWLTRSPAPSVVRGSSTPASTGSDAPDKAAVDAARETLSAESKEKTAHQALRAAQSEGLSELP